MKKTLKELLKDKKIVIYYDNRYGRNDGPPLYYYHAMKMLGLDVVHSLPINDTSAYNGKVDYHFLVDWGEDAVIGRANALAQQIPKDGGKTIYVASDTHLDDGYRFEKAKQFDYVYFNQKKAVEEYKGNSSWLPHAVNPSAYYKFDILKKYDWCFIGHLQDQKNNLGITRVDMLDRMCKEFPNSYVGWRNPMDPSINMFDDAAKKFSQSKIVTNISIRDDVNMRVFEALATGSMLLTNWLPTIEKLFIDEKHLILYSDLDDMVEKTKYYLEHEEKREKIAQAGMIEVLKHHTYQLRVQEIFGDILNERKSIPVSDSKGDSEKI